MDFPIEIQSEFDYIVRAFQFVAMMFGPGSGYMGLLATLGAMGIFFGGMSAISSQALSGKAAIQSWFVNMIVASVIIVLLLGSKSTVIIHDTVSNQLRSIGGVPTVMATLAYMENRISQGVKDMMETVMQPIIPYDDIGRGEGFELLASLDKGVENYIMRYPYIFESISDYANKCALKDVSSGWIKKMDTYSTVNLWEAIRSETRVNFSVVYAENDPQGSLAECADAWTIINNMLKASQVNSAVRGLCEEKYTDANAINECMQNQENIVAGIMAGPKFSSIDLNSVIVSYLASYAMHSSEGTLYKIQNDMNKKNASSTFIAETMVPKLKGMLYGIIIGLFPLLVCFIWFSPTKTVTYYAGMFLFLILWGAIDTYLNMQYLNETYNAFTWLRNIGLGMNQMFDIPNKAADAVSRYGSGRWLALGLAAAISSALTGASSYAMSQMGSQMSSAAQSAAAANAGYLDSAGNFQLNKQASVEQGQRELGLNTPVANYNGYADQTYQQEKTSMQTGSGLKDHYGSNDMVANANAMTNMTSTVEHNAASLAKNKEQGGLSGVESLTSDKTTFDVNQTRTQLDFMKNTFGDLPNAGKASGEAGGMNQAESIVSMRGRTAGAGGVDKLLDQAYGSGKYEAAERGSFLTSQINEYNDLIRAGEDAGISKGYGQLGQNYSAFTNYQEVIGNTDATNKMAAALGMNVSELAEFIKGRNVLDGSTAAFLNNKYKTGIFEAGQTFNFSMRKDNGQLTEMSLTDNVQGRQLGSYVFGGTQQTVLNDDGSAVSSRYDGIFSKNGRSFAGGITTDASDSVIAASGSSGTELIDKLIDTKTTQMDDTFDVMQSILAGDKRVFEYFNGLTGEAREAAYRQFAGSLANEAGSFLIKNEQNQWGTNLQGGVQVQGQLDTKKSIAGKIVSATTGIGGSITVSGSAGISRLDTSFSQQNVIASEIYDILNNANGNADVMASNTQEYLKGLVGENLAGMPVVGEKISNALDQVKGLGFGAKGGVYKDDNGNIKNSQYILENGEWIKK